MGTVLIIDSVPEPVRCNLQRLGGLGLDLRYVLERHVHVGQIVGAAGFMVRALPLRRSSRRCRESECG
jgi:hypothetical protein